MANENISYGVMVKDESDGLRGARWRSLMRRSHGAAG